MAGKAKTTKHSIIISVKTAEPMSGAAVLRGLKRAIDKGYEIGDADFNLVGTVSKVGVVYAE